MEVVHAHKLIHLDLKPENVLLAADGTPWVTDFGLSISTNKGSESVIRGRGTLRYKAPELFSDQTPTPAVDVYAFAILAWVMITREEPFSEVQSIDTSLSFHLEKGKRPSLANGHDWRGATAPNLSKIVEACWAQEQSERPPFGGDGGVLQMLVDLESRLPRKTDDKALVRLLSAECDAKTTEGRIKELEQADASAAAGLKEVLKEEREGEMVTLQRHQEMVQQAAQQAAQQTGAIVVEKLELFHRESEQSLDEIKRAVHAGNVTLEQMARGELDCPRLVFIFPAPRVEGRTLAGRLADKIPNLQDKYRLVFLDPVTGSAVPTGKDGKGYELKMPADWLLKHGKKLESGLAIVKLGLAVGRLAGLPLPDLDELGVMPREGQIMAEARAVKAFEAVLDGAATSAGTEDSVPSTRQSRSSRVSARGTPAEAATGLAYRALKELISTQCEDPNLLHCGLQKERADDGTVEWVAPESKDRFIKEGAACLIWVEE